jgi:hypothetical protein
MDRVEWRVLVLHKKQSGLVLQGRMFGELQKLVPGDGLQGCVLWGSSSSAANHRHTLHPSFVVRSLTFVYTS